MPTIHDLPLETIENILAVAHSFDSDNWLEQRARRRSYLDTSLVCRDWTPFAQRALWRIVKVGEAGVTLLIKSGGAGRLSIETLMVYGARSSSLGTLLSSARGVRDLKLSGCSIDGSWLSGDNWRSKSRRFPRSLTTSDLVLADLKSLSLVETMVVSTGVPAYHFSLTHLALQYARDDLCDKTLVALSRQLTITSLDLYLDGLAAEMLDQLSPLASQLVRLDLGMLDDDEAAVPRIVDPFLELCTRLKHLTFSAEYTPSVIYLPRLLQSWTLTSCQEADVALTLGVLNSKATAVSKLQRLTIHYNSRMRLAGTVRKVQSWDGWSELQEVCRQKKITLSVKARLSSGSEAQGESMFPPDEPLY
jgi:hypothetical protein